MKDKPYLGASDPSQLFKYPKCNYCGTDKSVKYEDNREPYCNLCKKLIIAYIWKTNKKEEV